MSEHARATTEASPSPAPAARPELKAITGGGETTPKKQDI